MKQESLNTGESQHSRDRVEAAARSVDKELADSATGPLYIGHLEFFPERAARQALAAADECDVANGVVRLAGDAASIERYCEMLHDAYESAAEHWGWATNPESRKPWVDVPERNKMTMRMALGNLLAALGAAGVGERGDP